MERLLRSRLGAARLALEDAPGEERAIVSQTQANAVVAMITPHIGALSPASQSSLGELARAGKWLDTDLSRILACIHTTPDVPSSAPKPERQPQHWAPAIFAYFKKSEWARMQTGRCIAECEALMLDRIWDLGGRSLGEPTLKCVTSCILAMCIPNAECTNWAVKHSYYTQLKTRSERGSGATGTPGAKMGH